MRARACEDAQIVLGALVVQFAPSRAHQRDERPRVQVALRVLGTTAQRRVGEVRHGVCGAKALELLGGVFELCHGEHRGVADTSGVVGRKVQAAICGFERHAVAAANEGARCQGGEPAQIGAARKVACGLTLVGVLRRGDLERQIVLHLVALGHQILHVFLVGAGGEGGQHALSVPVGRIECGRLAEHVLGSCLFLLCLGIVRDKGNAVVDSLDHLGNEVPGAVAVVHDERCGVAGELFHQTLYGGTVGERDIVAAQGLKNEAMAILLNGIECHGASFAAVRVQISLYKVLVYPHVAHRGCRIWTCTFAPRSRMSHKCRHHGRPSGITVPQTVDFWRRTVHILDGHSPARDM